MKTAKWYMLITQLIIQVLVLVGLGYYIGYKIDPDGLQKGILACVGVVIGIGYFIFSIIRIGGKDERKGKL